MALVNTPHPAESMPQPGGPNLKLVSDIHPPQEGVFDSGQHFIFNGEAWVEGRKINWTLEVPENRSYDGVGFFVPGFVGVEGSSHAPRGALAKHGISGLSYMPARGGSIYETARNPQLIHAKSIHEIGKVVCASPEITAHIPDPQSIDLSKKILLAHSMGSLGATEDALHEPDQVEAIFYLAGCNVGHPTIIELAIDLPKGIPAGIRHELIPSLFGREVDVHPRTLLQLASYLLRARTIPEMFSCLSHDKSEQIAQLRQLGIFTGYQAYDRDILVRADPRVAEHVDVHDIMLDAGHLAPIRRAQRVAGWVASTLTSRV